MQCVFDVYGMYGMTLDDLVAYGPVYITYDMLEAGHNYIFAARAYTAGTWNSSLCQVQFTATVPNSAPAKINKMDFAAAWTNIQTIAESLSRLSANVDSLIEAQRANVGAILENANETAARLNSLSQRLEENPSLLLRSSEPEPLPETDF